jgi:hypothetical protein
LNLVTRVPPPRAEGKSGLDRFHRRFRRPDDPIHLQYGLTLDQILLDGPVSNAGTVKNVQKMTQGKND